MAASSEELVHTTDEMKSDIVCPVCLMIAIASAKQSDGKLGAIQSYRCSPRPNSGGWETRPQKNDKWASDFFKVINTDRGEEVTLSDGETVVKGIGMPSETRFRFTHDDGVRARAAAIKFVKAGQLRAPRNWDRTFAKDAEISLDELKKTYPELYSSNSRSTSSPRDEEEPEIESLGEGFFGGEEETEGTSAVSTEHLDEGDEEMIASEEAKYQQQQEEEPSYSVMAELELEEEAPSKSSNEMTEMNVQKPTGGMILHTDTFKAEMGDGSYTTFVKINDPASGKWVWVHEGRNEDLSHLDIKLIA